MLIAPVLARHTDGEGHLLATQYSECSSRTSPFLVEFIAH